MPPTAGASRHIRIVFLRRIAEIPASGRRRRRFLRDTRGDDHFCWRLPWIRPWIHWRRIKIPSSAGYPPPAHAAVMPVMNPMPAAPNCPIVFVEMRDVPTENFMALVLRIRCRTGETSRH